MESLTLNTLQPLLSRVQPMSILGVPLTKIVLSGTVDSCRFPLVEGCHWWTASFVSRHAQDCPGSIMYFFMFFLGCTVAHPKFRPIIWVWKYPSDFFLWMIPSPNPSFSPLVAMSDRPQGNRWIEIYVDWSPVPWREAMATRRTAIRHAGGRCSITYPKNDPNVGI